MKRDDAKVRLLLIERMLRYDQVISATSILKKLKLYGILADRKTVYDDIYAINRVMPVEVISGKNGGFRRVDILSMCDES